MIALFPNCAFLSETSRMLAIAQALQARGVPVTMATHGGPFTRVLEQAGMPFTLLPPVMNEARSAEYLDGIVNLGQPGASLQPADEVRASVKSEVELLRATEARMVVIGFTLSAYLSARVAGVPLAASHGGSFVPPVFERRLAPVPVQAAVPQLEWLPSFAKRLMANLGPPRLRAPVAFLNEIADELGVERVPSLAALMLGDLTLVTDVPDVLGVSRADMEAWRPRGNKAYRKDTRLTYVGPIFARLDVPVPARVQAFLDGSRPTAYVALSSSTPELIRSAVAGACAAGLRVIVGATIHELADLERDDVVVGGVLPSHIVMPEVNVAVIMGGQGSVQTAMASGTPFVGLPLHGEQELNVGLGVRNGMAIALAPRRADEAQVAAAVREIVGKSSYGIAAKRVQSLYAGVDGPANAADALIEYLGSRPAPHG